MTTDWIFIGNIVLTIIALGLILYLFGKAGIFFGEVGEGEIVVIMYSGIAYRYIGKITGHWVEKETGKVWKTGTEDLSLNQKPERKLGQPKAWYGLYCFGVWPWAKKYTYILKYNKYSEKVIGEGKRGDTYEIIPREGIADSIFFQASHAVKLPENETNENVPLSLGFNLTIQVRNADTALFKSRDWPNHVTGAVTAVVRDFVGSKSVTDITTMKMEVPTSGNRSELMENILALNTSDSGNPSIEELYGITIVAVNFLGYSFDEPKNEVQKVAIAKYNAQRKAEAEVAEQKGKKAAFKTINDNIKNRGIAEGKAGIAKAVGLKAERDAIAGCPELIGLRNAEAAVKMAESAGGKLTTLVYGNAVPTIPIK